MVLPKVVIGIPTFKRPQGLSRLLDSIALQNVEFDVHIVVADNDEIYQEGLIAAEKYCENGFPFPISAFLVKERGISHIRNFLLDKAFDELDADYLAMLDDDEWAENNWLIELINMQKKTQAHIVGGHVSPEFEGQAPNWLKDLAIYYQSGQPKNGPVELIQGTTNVLLHKSVLSEFSGEKFDCFYSLVGGGDKEFFMRLKLKGARFAFAEFAKSHEFFSKSRLTKSWALERAFRIGAGDMRIILKSRASILNLVFELAKLISAGSIALLKMSLHYNCEQKRMAARLLLHRQKGKLSALFGKQKSVYKQTHGS